MYAVQREILLLGAELAACKWSGEYIIDSVWNDDDETRSWDEWLKRRDFKLTSAGSEIKIGKDKAAALMAWSSCTATISEANARRFHSSACKPSPLGALSRFASTADDWKPENWPERKAPANAFETEPPYAAQQPDFLKKWEAFNQLPPEKRLTKKGFPSLLAVMLRATISPKSVRC